MTTKKECAQKRRVPHPCDFQGCGFSPVKHNPLERRYGQGDFHFITFSCIRRRPLLGAPEARGFFVRILDEVRTRYQFRLIGYVVMPEHVHLLISEPRKGNPSKAIQVLKQRVSAALPSGEGNCEDTEGHFWHRRFYDFNVYRGLKITEKLNYMHLNPINRNLVAHLRDWPWSSWSHYAGVGPVLIAIDRWDEPARAENPHPCGFQGCGFSPVSAPWNAAMVKAPSNSLRSVVSAVRPQLFRGPGVLGRIMPGMSQF